MDETSWQRTEQRKGEEREASAKSVRRPPPCETSAAGLSFPGLTGQAWSLAGAPGELSGSLPFTRHRCYLQSSPRGPAPQGAF